MGKKRMAVLGSEDEQQLKASASVKREQKKLRGGLPAGRQGKTAKAPGLAGGQRVVDTTAESLAEYEQIQAKIKEATAEPGTVTKAKPVRVRSQTYQGAKAKVDPARKYALAEAIQLLRDVSYSKANNTVELHVSLTEPVGTKDVDLPHSTGMTRRIAVADAATIAKIAAGKIDFDVLLASPADMPSLVKYAKVLGPRGLMPNPKNNTIVDNPEAAAKKLSSSNTISLKTEKDTPVIHTVAGKLTMADSQLDQNIAAILSSLPAGKIAKVVLKSTMSPAIKLQV